MERAFIVYLETYPDYAETGPRNLLYARWLDYAEASEEWSLPCCLSAPHGYQLRRMLEEPDADVTISYCGRFAGDPETSYDWLAKMHIDVIEHIALKGSVAGLSVYLQLDGKGRVVNLNPDVVYYLKSAILSSDNPTRPDYLFDENDASWRDQPWNRPNLEEELSPERKAFVDEAVARGDLAAVLETTGPCGDTAWRGAD